MCYIYIYLSHSRKNALVFSFNKFSGKKVNLVGAFGKFKIIGKNNKQIGIGNSIF